MSKERRFNYVGAFYGAITAVVLLTASLVGSIVIGHGAVAAQNTTIGQQHKEIVKLKSELKSVKSQLSTCTTAATDYSTAYELLRENLPNFVLGDATNIITEINGYVSEANGTECVPSGASS